MTVITGYNPYNLVGVAACILIAGLGAAAGRLALPQSGLRGNYYTNLTRSGPPIAVSIDRSLSTDTLDNGTAGVWPAFSVEWSGFFIVERAGVFEFATMSDDGSELEVADRVVVHNGGVHGPKEARGTIELAAGVHPIRVRYEQAGGGFELAVNVSEGGGPLTSIPPSRLTPDPITYPAYRVRRAIPWVAALLAVGLWLVVSRFLPVAGGTRHVTPLPERDLPPTRHAIAIIVVVSVAVRVLMMLGSDAILWPDSDVFLGAVDAIRAGRYLDHDPFRTLLYPYFLAPFLIVRSEPPMDQVIVAAQHLLGVGATVGFYLAGRAALGSRPALAGALLFSVHTTQLFYEASIMSEVFFGFVLALCLIPMSRFIRRPSLRGAIATGLACAALTYTRPVAQWFFLVPAAVAALQLPPQRAKSARWGPRLPSWRARIAVPATVALTFAALMLPWALVNQRQHGFFGVAIGTGFGLYIRVFELDRFDPPESTRYPDARDVLLRARATHQYSPATHVRDFLGGGRKYSVIQKDAVMAGAAIEAVRARPVQFAINTFRQWGKQLGGPLGDEGICRGAQGAYVCSIRTIGYAREPFLNRPRYADEPVRRWVVAYFRHFRFPMTIVSALAAFGIITAIAERRRHRMAVLFLALVIAYFTFLPAFAQSPQDRYRLPVDALLLMFAACGVMRLIQEIRPSSAAATATARQATLNV